MSKVQLPTAVPAEPSALFRDYSDDDFEIAMLLRETLVVCCTQIGVNKPDVVYQGQNQPKVRKTEYRFLEYSCMLPVQEGGDWLQRLDHSTNRKEHRYISEDGTYTLWCMCVCVCVFCGRL